MFRRRFRDGIGSARVPSHSRLHVVSVAHQTALLVVCAAARGAARSRAAAACAKLEDVLVADVTMVSAPPPSIAASFVCAAARRPEVRCARVLRSMVASQQPRGARAKPSPAAEVDAGGAAAQASLASRLCLRRAASLSLHHPGAVARQIKEAGLMRLARAGPPSRAQQAPPPAPIRHCNGSHHPAMRDERRAS